MDNTQCIKLIQNCLKNDDNESDHSITTMINIRTPDFVVKSVKTYELDFESVVIIDSHESEEDEGFTGAWELWTIFQHSKGYGIAHNNGWQDYTFGGDEYVLDVFLGDDMDAFDKTCLTNEVRDKAIQFYLEKELLTK